MAWIHAFDHDAPASSPQDQSNDILIRAAHGVTFGSHTAAHPQMLQDAAKNLVVAFKSCCRLKIRPVSRMSEAGWPLRPAPTPAHIEGYLKH